VILPSFTFASTANAFVLRGAVPVFVDIERSTFNLDPLRVAEAVTSRTRAIVAVHYAGVPCDLDALTAIAANAGAMLIEDAAQSLLSTHNGRPLGTFGTLAALSFHQTKNISAGEGGALIVNDPRLVRRAEIIREKGTNRREFARGEVDKYTWFDIGSSYVASELIAAFLLAQLERAHELTQSRLALWNAYHSALATLEQHGDLQRPTTPGNGHIYAVLLASRDERTRVIAALRECGVSALFHYVPLHSSPAGRRYGRTSGSLEVTDDISDRLLRLPIWPQMTGSDVEIVVCALQEALATSRAAHG
jgi:dTDP-4-amino-4,6-dideoxygalactose transaminase